MERGIRKAAPPGPLQKAWGWICSLATGQVQAVPRELAACEFDCDELNCNQSQWASCEKRLAQQRDRALEDTADPKYARR